jgi:Flp pilus assembly protein TadD
MPNYFKTSDHDRVRDDHTESGRKLLEAGHIEQARQIYQQALALDPENAEAHRNLSVVLKQSGDMESAVKHLKKALYFQGDCTGMLKFSCEMVFRLRFCM